jgi:hypothetical protein
MKKVIVISQLVILAFVSCSRPPSALVGTWEPKRETSGSVLQPEPARYILVLRSDGTGEVDREQRPFRERMCPLRWEQKGDKLILSEANGGKRALTVLEKTETTLKVLQPASPADTTPGTLVTYIKAGNAK